MTEYEKMQRGEVYLATDPSLLRELHACQDKCWEYNRLCPTDARRRNEMIREILGGADEDTFVNQPFHCDYGKHIFVGKRFFSNFNFTVLDEARVSIGDDCFIGPNVSIYTACHSTDPVERNTRREWAEPVTIGDNCVIGAGSVVTHDIPSDSFAAGVPCRVIRSITEADSMRYLPDILADNRIPEKM